MSNEKRPVGSVSDASMSPRASLTTNVLPSRILTRSSLMPVPPSGRAGRGRRARCRPRRATVPRSIAANGFALPLTTLSSVFRSVFTTASAASFARDTLMSPFLIATRHRVVRPLSFTSKRTVPVTFSSSGFVPALGEPVEEFCGRPGHRRPPSGCSNPFHSIRARAASCGRDERRRSPDLEDARPSVRVVA